MTKLLFTPLNFGVVEDGLYRSGFPNELNFAFLSTLQLKTVLCLETSSALLDPFLQFTEEQHIQYINFSNNTQSPDGAAHENLVKETLQNYIFNKKCYPLLIVDRYGKYLTGVLVGCLRKYQRWAFASIFEEYRRFAGSRLLEQHEQFIELFDTDLVAPVEESAPSFLIYSNMQ